MEYIVSYECSLICWCCWFSSSKWCFSSFLWHNSRTFCLRNFRFSLFLNWLVWISFCRQHSNFLYFHLVHIIVCSIGFDDLPNVLFVCCFAIFHLILVNIILHWLLRILSYKLSILSDSLTRFLTCFLIVLSCC